MNAIKRVPWGAAEATSAGVVRVGRPTLTLPDGYGDGQCLPAAARIGARYCWAIHQKPPTIVTRTAIAPPMTQVFVATSSKRVSIFPIETLMAVMSRSFLSTTRSSRSTLGSMLPSCKSAATIKRFDVVVLAPLLTASLPVPLAAPPQAPPAATAAELAPAAHCSACSWRLPGCSAQAASG